MQILFINILMDGASPYALAAASPMPLSSWSHIFLLSSGPPSQSLGVDPVDHAVMRKPPRKKDEPIISRRILMRVLFSATVIVAGTLFIYYFALSDDHNMSRRDQTMVRIFPTVTYSAVIIELIYPLWADILLFRFPRSRLGGSEPRTRLRDHTEPNVVDHCRGLVHIAARAGLRPLHASYLSDRGATDGRPTFTLCVGGIVVCAARVASTVRAFAEPERDVCDCDGGACMMDGGHGDRDGHIGGCGICAMEVDDPIYYYACGCVFWLLSATCGRNSYRLLGRCRCTDHGRTRKTLLKEQALLK